MADEQLIKPRELPAATTVFSDDAIMTDDGVTVGKATPVQIVNAGAPVPTEAEAIAGTDNSKRMTPLTVKQVLDSVTAPSVLRAQAWAESDSPPNPGIPSSMSAKSWAAEAERLGSEQADRAEAAAAQAALYDGPVLDTVREVISDTALTYATGSPSSVAVGQIVRTRNGSAFQVVASDAATYDVANSNPDAPVRMIALKDEENQSVRAVRFGIPASPVTDSSALMQHMLNRVMADRTSPSGASGYGQNIIELPKGRIRMTSGLLATSSLLDIEFRGQGPWATTIEFENDTADFLGCGPNISTRFRDIGIAHIPQTNNRSEWSNTLFRSAAVGGGRHLEFDNARVDNFDRVICNTGTINFDTIEVNGSFFRGFKTFFWSRSSQSVLNCARSSTFHGGGDLCDVEGGAWDFDTCDIILDGTWVKFNATAGSTRYGGQTRYYFRSSRGEAFNTLGHADGCQTRIVDIVGADPRVVAGAVIIEGGGLDTTRGVDPSVHQIKVTPSLRVEFSHGFVSSDVKVGLLAHAQAPSARLHKRGLYFRDMENVPPPANVTVLGTPTTGDITPKVVYDDCSGQPNMVLNAGSGSTGITTLPLAIDRRPRSNSLGPASSTAVIASTSGTVMNIDFGAAKQAIDDISVGVSVSSGSGSVIIETSLDNFATVIDRFNVPGGTSDRREGKASRPALGSKAHNWPSLADGAQQSTTVTVIGAKVGDPASAYMSVDLSGTFLWAEVTADDTVTVYHRNTTGAAVDVANGTLTAQVQRQSTLVGQVVSGTVYVRGTAAVGLVTGWITVDSRAR